MSILWYIVSGVCSGIIAGMGMGGGTILIPVLTLIFGIGQHDAQGVNIMSFIPAAIVAIIIHRREGRINFRECLPIICAGAVTAAVGAIIAMNLDGMLLRRLYGVFLGGLCVVQFISGEKAYKEQKQKRNKG